MANPFSINFGREPMSFIGRDEDNIDIIEAYTAQNAEFQVCMLTGVRGSGKTVSMTTIANRLAEDPQWVVVDLNPERDLLCTLAAELNKRPTLKSIFENASFSLSLPGMGMEFSPSSAITDIAVTLGDALELLTKQGKKLLVTIDEVSNNKNVREFASQFQIYMRKNYNVYLIMTGIYENIYELQNEKSLTFLYRAPKIEMKPLSIPMIMQKYKEFFCIEDTKALEMAKLTKGYPYAYQVLGYLCFKRNAYYENVMGEFDTFLEEYVYQKIWSEVSRKDQELLTALAKSDTGRTEEIRNLIGMPLNKYSVYRNRLIKKGLIRAVGHGHLELSLPRFKEFILRNIW